MLADSGAELTGWLAFVVLVLASAGIVPLGAALLRRRLPDRLGLARHVSPLRLGQSPKTRRSPRHAVAAHRTFLTGTSMTSISLVLIPFVAALGVLDLSGLLIATAFVCPSLIVILHSRRRDLGEGSGP
jgi:hypothetical protein